MLDQKIVEDIQRLGKVIETNKAEKAKYEGAMEQILANLKQAFNIESIDQAKALLKEYEQKSLEKEVIITDILKKLTDNIVW